MEISRTNVEVWKRNFRRKYASDLPGLRTLADSIAAEASDSVTITHTSEEGGDTSGQITGNKLELLSAAEELLVELDAETAQAVAAGQPVRVIYPLFSGFAH